MKSKKKKGIVEDLDLDADDMKRLVVEFKQFYRSELKEEFPSDPRVQLFGALKLYSVPGIIRVPYITVR